MNERGRSVYEVAIVGGGLAGLMAAARAETLGASVVLIDASVVSTAGSLGGFAPFSGAKFSLFPAGTGIGPIVGGDDALIARYRQVCTIIAALGFPRFEVTDRQLMGAESSTKQDLSYRRYHSILLSTLEMTSLVSALSARLSHTKVVRANATHIAVSGGAPFEIQLGTRDVIVGKTLIMAAGRLGSGLLEAASVPQTSGKGIDIGVRLAFDDRVSVAGLRELGPDAKFMAAGVRTFCLNSPGRIFHYPGLGYSLPGGVVAEADWPESNVGVLCRLPDRAAFLREFSRQTPPLGALPLSQPGSGLDLGWSESSRKSIGEQVAKRIDEFVVKLENSGLVKLPNRYVVHYPLLDWYWPVFSLPGRLTTAVPGLFATGDASGHARGLMQAAVMGILAAEEALR